MLHGRFGNFKMLKKILVFGASGSIGRAIISEYNSVNSSSKLYDVMAISSQIDDKVYKKISTEADLKKLNLSKKSIHGVIWAQGINTNDSIFNIDIDIYKKVFDVNVTYILKTLSWMISNDLLANNAKICIVSSIWQELSRQEKLSYSISKSAIKGLVLSLSNDLAKKGIMVNGILPGAIDNEMTNKNLTKNQLSNLKNSNSHNKLIKSSSAAKTALWLCSDDAEGITGEFIKIDYGYSKIRTV